MESDTHNFELQPQASEIFDLELAWQGVTEEEAQTQAEAAYRHAIHLAEEGAKDPENGAFWSNQIKQLNESKERRAGYDQFINFAREVGQRIACMCENEGLLNFVKNDSYLNDSFFGHSENDGHNHGGGHHDQADSSDRKKDKKKKRRTSWLAR